MESGSQLSSHELGVCFLFFSFFLFLFFSFFSFFFFPFLFFILFFFLFFLFSFSFSFSFFFFFPFFLFSFSFFLFLYQPFFPPLSPNLVTLIGFIAIIAQYALIAFYCPQLEGEAPRWVYVFSGFCVFFYQTMDALDGKQARRTGCSSPMGEIFDHGCDALSLSFLFLATCTVAQIGLDELWLPLTLGAGIGSFFLTQWEEYHTDIMYLGYVNVTEAQVAIMMIHWTAAYAGPFVFAETYTILGVSLTLGRWVMCAVIAGGCFTGGGNLITLIGFFAKDMSTLPQKLFHSFLQLIPMIQILTCLLMWPRLSPQNFDDYIHFILLGCGTLSSIVIGELVLFRVAQQTYPLLHPLLLPTLVPFVIAYVPALQPFEGLFAMAFGVFGVVSYFACARSVLLELSEIFGINVFTIPPGGYSFNKKE